MGLARIQYRFTGAALAALAVVLTGAVQAGEQATYCDACFTGNYPVEVAPAARRQLRLIEV